jgi:hypothetical protein
VVDNAIPCTTAAILSFTSSNPEFGATAASNCSTISANFTTPVSASSYPASITFAATAGGPQTATLNANDTANGGTGTATLNGIGQETPQTITFTAPTTLTDTYAPGLTITLGATGGASNNPVIFTLDSSSTGTGTITGNSLLVTAAGNLVIDANQVGGLVSGIYYSAAAQVQLTIAITKASQTIAFPPPTSPVTYVSGLVLTLGASGGASGNAVVFSVDGTSTASGTVSGNKVTVTGAGNLVIDANQTGNTDYSAAAQVQQTIVVNQATQAITFTPPTQPIHFILGGITVTVVAAGGPSGQPIVFTVDKASTGAGTFTGNVLSVTALGNIVIDANQAGNNNYLAAPQAQETIAILTPLPTQTITFTNPGTQVTGTPLTLTATTSSGLPASYTSSTTTVCTVAGSTATFVAAGNCTITAAQPGDNLYFAAAPSVSQTFIVNPAGQIPSMALNFSLPYLAVQAGTVGISTITVNSTNQFAGTVSFACSGLPTGDTCSFNPNPITVPAGGSATTTLSVATTAKTASLHDDSRPLFPLASLAVVVCLFGFRKRNRLHMLLLLVVSLVALGTFTACNSTSGTTPGASTQTTVTITATSGKITQSATFTLSVN